MLVPDTIVFPSHDALFTFTVALCSFPSYVAVAAFAVTLNACFATVAVLFVVSVISLHVTLL